MGDYFKPMRRKIGLLTLLMACVVMGIWIRSFHRGDFLSTDLGQMVSFRGRLFIQRWVEATITRFRVRYDSEDDRHTSDVYEDPEFDELWQWRWCGFAAGETISEVTSADGTSSKTHHAQYLLPYWSVVVPLTLLSAWLLLRKPRAESKSSVEISVPD